MLDTPLSDPLGSSSGEESDMSSDFQLDELDEIVPLDLGLGTSSASAIDASGGDFLTNLIPSSVSFVTPTQQTAASSRRSSTLSRRRWSALRTTVLAASAFGPTDGKSPMQRAVDRFNSWCESPDAVGLPDAAKHLVQSLSTDGVLLAKFAEEADACGRISAILKAELSSPAETEKLFQGLSILRALAPSLTLPSTSPLLADVVMPVIQRRLTVACVVALEAVLETQDPSIAYPICKMIFEQCVEHDLRVVRVAVLAIAGSAMDSTLTDSISWIVPSLTVMNSFVAASSANDELLNELLDVLFFCLSSHGGPQRFIDSGGVLIVLGLFRIPKTGGGILSTTEDPESEMTPETVARLLKLISPRALVKQGNFKDENEPSTGGDPIVAPLDPEALMQPSPIRRRTLVPAVAAAVNAEMGRKLSICTLMKQRQEDDPWLGDWWEYIAECLVAALRRCGGRDHEERRIIEEGCVVFYEMAKFSNVTLVREKCIDALCRAVRICDASLEHALLKSIAAVVQRHITSAKDEVIRLIADSDASLWFLCYCVQLFHSDDDLSGAVMQCLLAVTSVDPIRISTHIRNFYPNVLHVLDVSSQTETIVQCSMLLARACRTGPAACVAMMAAAGRRSQSSSDIGISFGAIGKASVAFILSLLERLLEDGPRDAIPHLLLVSKCITRMLAFPNEATSRKLWRAPSDMSMRLLPSVRVGPEESPSTQGLPVFSSELVTVDTSTALSFMAALQSRAEVLCRSSIGVAAVALVALAHFCRIPQFAAEALNTLEMLETVRKVIRESGDYDPNSSSDNLLGSSRPVLSRAESIELNFGATIRLEGGLAEGSPRRESTAGRIAAGYLIAALFVAGGRDKVVRYLSGKDLAAVQQAACPSAILRKFDTEFCRRQYFGIVGCLTQIADESQDLAVSKRFGHETTPNLDVVINDVLADAAIEDELRQIRNEEAIESMQADEEASRSLITESEDVHIRSLFDGMNREKQFHAMIRKARDREIQILNDAENESRRRFSEHATQSKSDLMEAFENGALQIVEARSLLSTQKLASSAHQQQLLSSGNASLLLVSQILSDTAESADTDNVSTVQLSMLMSVYTAKRTSIEGAESTCRAHLIDVVEPALRHVANASAAVIVTSPLGNTASGHAMEPPAAAPTQAKQGNEQPHPGSVTLESMMRLLVQTRDELANLRSESRAGSTPRNDVHTNAPAASQTEFPLRQEQDLSSHRQRSVAAAAFRQSAPRRAWEESDTVIEPQPAPPLFLREASPRPYQRRSTSTVGSVMPIESARCVFEPSPPRRALHGDRSELPRPASASLARHNRLPVDRSTTPDGTAIGYGMGPAGGHSRVRVPTSSAMQSAHTQQSPSRFSLPQASEKEKEAASPTPPAKPSQPAPAARTATLPNNNASHDAYDEKDAATSDVPSTAKSTSAVKQAPAAAAPPSNPSLQRVKEQILSAEPCVQKIDLHNAQLDDGSLHILLQLLRSSSKLQDLQELDLSDNHISNTYLQQLLFAVLFQKESLTVLKLNGNTEIAGRAGLDIATFCKQKKSLRVLELHGTQVPFEQMTKIARILSERAGGSGHNSASAAQKPAAKKSLSSLSAKKHVEPHAIAIREVVLPKKASRRGTFSIAKLCSQMMSEEGNVRETEIEHQRSVELIDMLMAQEGDLRSRYCNHWATDVAEAVVMLEQIDRHVVRCGYLADAVSLCSSDLLYASRMVVAAKEASQRLHLLSEREAIGRKAIEEDQLIVQSEMFARSLDGKRLVLESQWNATLAYMWETNCHTRLDITQQAEHSQRWKSIFERELSLRWSMHVDFEEDFRSYITKEEASAIQEIRTEARHALLALLKETRVKLELQRNEELSRFRIMADYIEQLRLDFCSECVEAEHVDRENFTSAQSLEAQSMWPAMLSFMHLAICGEITSEYEFVTQTSFCDLQSDVRIAVEQMQRNEIQSAYEVFVSAVTALQLADLQHTEFVQRQWQMDDWHVLRQRLFAEDLEPQLRGMLEQFCEDRLHSLQNECDAMWAVHNDNSEAENDAFIHYEPRPYCSIMYPDGVSDEEEMIEFVTRCGSRIRSIDVQTNDYATNNLIFAVIEHCPIVESINVADTYGRISDDALIAAAKAYSNSLREVTVGNDGEKITDASISEIASHCLGLQYLNVSSTEGFVTDASILQIALHCGELQVLDVSKTAGAITDRSITAIAMHCRKLKELDVGWTKKRISDVSISHVADNCPELEVLNVQNTAGVITDASMCQVAVKCQYLSALSVSGTNGAITDKTILDVAQYCRTLQKLDVTETRGKITDTSIKEISTWCPILECLFVSQDCKEITDASTSLFAPECCVVRCTDMLANSLSSMRAMAVSLDKTVASLSSTVRSATSPRRRSFRRIRSGARKSLHSPDFSDTRQKDTDASP